MHLYVTVLICELSLKVPKFGGVTMTCDCLYRKAKFCCPTA